MGLSIWVRFATPEGTILGEVTVPKKCPAWFKGTLAQLQESATRDLTMDDVGFDDWMGAHFSVRRPIHVHRPLAPQQQDELVFFLPGKFNEMKNALAELGTTDGKPDQTKQAAVLHDDTFLRKYAILMDDIEKIPPTERVRLRPVPRAKLQPNNQNVRTFVVYNPLVPPESKPSETLETFRLNPERINHYVAIAADSGFRRNADAAYSGGPSLYGSQAQESPPTQAASQIGAHA